MKVNSFRYAWPSHGSWQRNQAETSHHQPKTLKRRPGLTLARPRECLHYFGVALSEPYDWWSENIFRGQYLPRLRLILASRCRHTHRCSYNGRHHEGRSNITYLRRVTRNRA
jgi:hypothetical protein